MEMLYRKSKFIMDDQNNEIFCRWRIGNRNVIFLRDFKKLRELHSSFDTADRPDTRAFTFYEGKNTGN